jgi:hypothetical protein
MLFVTVYTERFEPLAVIAVSNDQLRGLQAHRGDLHHRIVFDDRVNSNSARIATREITRYLEVQGQKWADGVSRPIIVVLGDEMCEYLSDRGRFGMAELASMLCDSVAQVSQVPPRQRAGRNRAADRVVVSRALWNGSPDMAYVNEISAINDQAMQQLAIPGRVMDRGTVQGMTIRADGAAMTAAAYAEPAVSMQDIDRARELIDNMNGVNIPAPTADRPYYSNAVVPRVRRRPVTRGPGNIT